MTLKVPKSVKLARATSCDKALTTKQVKSSARPAKLETEFKQVIDSTSDAIRVLNKNFTVRRINRAFSEMSGTDQHEVMGKRCWEIFPSPLCHTPDCRLQRILNGEKTVQVEIERKMTDGTTIPCVVTTSPLMDDMGKLTGIIEQFRDVTEHHRMEEQVKETEDRYKALVELGAEAGEAIIMLQDIDEAEGIQTFFNDQWPKLIGYTKRELLGTSFFKLVHPSDRQASVTRHRQKMSGKTISGLYEMKIIRKDGTIITVELTGAFTPYQGQPANVVYIRDITQRKKMQKELEQHSIHLEELVSTRTKELERELNSHKRTEKALQLSEDRYHSLFENVPVAIIEFDLSKTREFIDNLRSQGITDLIGFFDNPSHTNAFNPTSFSTLIGANKALLELYEASTIDDILKLWAEFGKSNQVYLKAFSGAVICITESKTRYDYDEFGPTCKGNWQHRQVTMSVAPGYEASLSKVYYSVFNITERKCLEGKLKNAYDREKLLKEKLTSQIKQKNEFTRALAHELKTPLTPIFSTSDYMVANMEEGPWLTAAKNINRGAARLNKRINELFDLTRFETGNLALRLAKENPLPVLKEVASDVSSMIDENGQHFVVDVPQSLPPITIDRERIYQVLLNLIENAIKFTAKGGKITLKARTSNDNFIVEVKNEGIELTPKAKERLFKPYYKCEDDRASLSGLGLGLALCKSFIELHHGKIWMKRQQRTNENIFGFSIPLKTG